MAREPGVQKTGVGAEHRYGEIPKQAKPTKNQAKTRKNKENQQKPSENQEKNPAPKKLSNPFKNQ